jgi:hypothetical protein
MIYLLTLLLLPGLSLSQAQEDDTTAAPQDDTVAIPGVPPGQDVDSGRGAGLQLEGQRQLEGQSQPRALERAPKRAIAPRPSGCATGHPSPPGALGLARLIPSPRPSCAHLRYFAKARAQARTMS